MRHIEPNLNPPDYEAPISDLEEEVLGFLEEKTLLPTVINDQIVGLVNFFEKTDADTEARYARKLAERLRDMARKLDAKYPVACICPDGVHHGGYVPQKNCPEHGWK